MTTTRNVTPEDLVAAIRRIAAERPDVRYQRPDAGQGCSYAKGTCTDGSVGCLLGQAMRQLGIDVGHSEDAEAIYFAGPLQVMEQERWPDRLAAYARWCEVVQDQQDAGKTWAECVRLADRKVPEIGGDV